MTTTPEPWFRKRRNQILVLIVVGVIALSASGYFGTSQPKSPNQVALTRTIGYFVHAYSFTLGLVPEAPGSHTFWLYPDNYLASLALSRYDRSNQSTSSFGLAISEALGSWAATLPPSYARNQYTILNSSTASFLCSSVHSISWLGTGGSPAGVGNSTVRTTANDGASSCASQYADLLLLQAIYYHKTGNDSKATQLLMNASADFDGNGFADRAFKSANSTSFGVYQTYKLALYVYASTCLGKPATDPNSQTMSGLLFRQQDNSTGGFFSGYGRNPSAGSLNANTETTALAALAIEAVLNPSANC